MIGFLKLRRWLDRLSLVSLLSYNCAIGCTDSYDGGENWIQRRSRCHLLHGIAGLVRNDVFLLKSLGVGAKVGTGTEVGRLDR